MENVNLSELKEREIDAQLSMKVAKVVWMELARDVEILRRAVARCEAKVLVCLVLLVLVGGCHTVNGLGKDLQAMTKEYNQEKE